MFTFVASMLCLLLGAVVGAVLLWPFAFSGFWRGVISRDKEFAKKFMTILAESLGGKLEHLDVDETSS